MAAAAARRLRPAPRRHILAAAMAAILYTALVVGAIMLYLLLRPGARFVRTVAGIAGLGAVAWAFTSVAEALPGGVGTGEGGAPSGFFLVFAIVAVAGA